MAIRVKSLRGVDREFSRFSCECFRVSDEVSFCVLGYGRDDLFRECREIVYISDDLDAALDELDHLNALLDAALHPDITNLFQEVGIS